MKKFTPFKLMLTFAGCFLGAGYVSGQELWQFFGSFGKFGFMGIFASAFLLAVFGIIIIRYVCISGISDMDKVIIRNDSRVLRRIFLFLEIFFLTGIYVIMTAGISALLNELFGIPEYVGGFIFAVIVSLVSVTGLSGMVTAFSVTVPALVIMSFLLFAVSLGRNGISAIDINTFRDTNPLLDNWLISSLVFVSYNLFGSVGILAPLGKELNDKKTVYKGIAGGAFLLFIIALGILLTIFLSPEASGKELPMLYIAGKIHPVFSWIFAFLLFGGMFGTSLSSMFAVTEFVKSRLSSKKSVYIPAVIIVSVFAYLSSLFGFGKLIGTVYPVFGYLGFTALILIIINFIKAKKSENS